MATGTVKVRKDGGYGFIIPDDGSHELFFHVKDLARDTDERCVIAGARVEFDVKRGDRGPMAIRVRLWQDEPFKGSPPDPVAEAVAGMKQALLACLEWLDVLEAALKEQG